jgi:hypothetical protein
MGICLIIKKCMLILKYDPGEAFECEPKIRECCEKGNKPPDAK